MGKTLWWLAPLALPALAMAARRAQAKRRTLSVQAAGEFRARPDTAVVELALETESGELKEAYVQAQVEAERVRARLRSSGFAPEAALWGEFQVSSGDGKYRLRAGADLVIPELRMLDPLVAALSGMGLKPLASISFRLRNVSAAEEEAVAEACRNAHRRAVALARHLNLGLGDLQAVRLDQMASGAPARVSLSVEGGEAAAPSTPQEIIVTASVSAVYRLDD
ncbi:MAG: SIMPL domain-containing protein [Terriglobales bacterium]